MDGGSIEMESVPLHLWIIDRWLWLADKAVHLVDNRLPLDEHKWTAIDRLTPRWGNAICAAYLFVWSDWYNRRVTPEVYVSVPLDKLSLATQEWAKRDLGVG